MEETARQRAEVRCLASAMNLRVADCTGQVENKVTTDIRPKERACVGQNKIARVMHWHYGQLEPLQQQ